MLDIFSDLFCNEASHRIRPSSISKKRASVLGGKSNNYRCYYLKSME